MIANLPDDEDAQALIESAFEQWATGADVRLDPIAPGYSGSSLFKADIRASGASLQSGQYILKLSRFSEWQGTKPEFASHELAFKRNPAFSADHIPRLIKSCAAETDHRVGSGYAMLYEIAGGSLDRYAPTDARQDGRFLACARAILASLLRNWADRDVGEQLTAAGLLSDLCGYRLNATEAPSLHQFVAERIPNLQFTLGDYVLVNPLKFFELAQERGFGESAILNGLTHGDLHGGNILLSLMQPAEKPFYIIDFALAHEGAIGYDAAYLEVAHAMKAVGDLDPVLLINALHAAEEGDQSTPVPGDAHWIRDLIVQIRQSLEEWRAHEHPRRQDQIDRQLSLCRVAAGLNWANKPVNPAWRMSALCYASWAARQYLRTHERKIWDSLGPTSGARSAGTSQDDDDLWAEIWAATKGFDGAQAKFILVAERLKTESLTALGQLPWSVVIDLDPKSDEDGLHRQAGPVLSARRGVHEFSATIPTIDPKRGTGWMMAGGWSAKKEYFADPNDWRWQRLSVARDFVRRIAEETSPEPLHVMILPGATLDPGAPGARIGSIVAAIDEASRGRATIHLLGSRPIAETAKGLLRVPLSSTAFVHRVSTVFGTGFAASIAEVPGPDRQGRTIKLEALRAMEENLHVLHSTILDDQRETTGIASDFWRGRPPTWAELHAGVDIERTVHSELVRAIREKLEMHRNQTVILEHSPGAGGTTAAFRAAWELRSRYPVAVLHRYSAALPDRVRELFQIAEQPVLLVAEASDLTESAREDLYRYLSRNNCRVVLLYLRRTLAEHSEEAIHIPAPMDKAEAKSFLKVYRNLITDPGRARELDQITKRSNYEKYRLPFFYGLVTFEREFVGVDRFVQLHLTHVGRAVRDALEHLALVTIFSNGGLPLSLVRVLLDIDPQSSLTLEEVVGPDPARLLVERSGGVRFIHWTIADKVLGHFRGSADDEWRLDLKAYAIDFIRSSVAAAGSEAMRGLFRQMFIDRTGRLDEDDRENFAPIIESLDAIDKTLGHAVLEVLAEECPEDSHFWAHLGRHQVYRLGRDFDKAGEYLRRAVDLSPSDPLHHHTFGLVLRSQLRHRFRGLNRGASVDDVFNQVNPLFEQAAEEFAETRRLSPDNVYGYITHIQMIVMAAKELKRAAAVENIAEVACGRPDLDAWLGENLASAEDLLREATHLYATLDRSDQYLTRCEADLDALYGDLDSVVEIWEVANASGSGGTRGRRALANAYLARRERRWSALNEPEIRRVVELMEQNLREAGRRDDDYELWFNAYMLLPEFDVDEALSQLAVWAKKFPSWRAHYYRYVLHFLLWLERRTEDLNAFDAALEECTKRHVGRRSYSPVWYGVSAGGSGLVSESDLGKWTKELDFFSNAQALRRVNGMIDVINGPQAGTIKIAGRVKAFFVPGRSFSANRNENNPVHFFLGFSPSGLRAWSVQAGREGADRPEDEAAPAGSVVVPVQEPAIAAPAKRARVTALRKDRGMRFVRDLVAAKVRVGAKLSVADIEHHLDALMGAVGSALQLGINVKDVVEADRPQEKIVKTDGGKVNADGEKLETRLLGRVMLYDNQKKYGFICDQNGARYWFLRDFILPNERRMFGGRNSVVRFIPSYNERGGIAQGISVVRSGVLTPDGLIDESDAPAVVSRFAVTAVGEAAQGIEFSQLTRRVVENFFATGGLQRCLGGEDVQSFLEGIGDLEILARGRGTIVRLADDTLFGPPAEQPTPQGIRKQAMTPKAKTKVSDGMGAKKLAAPSQPSDLPLTVEVVKALVVDAIKAAQRDDRPFTMAMAGDLLKQKYPDQTQKIHLLVGFKRLSDLLATIEGLSQGPSPRCELTILES